MNNGKSGTGGTSRITRIINPLTRDCEKDWSELQQTNISVIMYDTDMLLRFIPT